jgi:radical SAM superfamily enzyme YgiQ (UPF0313 family)
MTIGRLRLKPMSYDFPPWRPPSEAGSLLVRVTRGCTWNKCSFCSMYKDLTFEQRPLDEVKADLQAAASLYSGEVRTVFIGDSNSPSMKTNDFAEILRELHALFPSIERITSYARAKTLLKKPAAELRLLRQEGLTRLHVGLETGNAELLKKIKKGATPDEMVAGCCKAKEAGFELSLYVLLGLGGEILSEAHASDTAAVLSLIDPDFIRVRTLQPQPGSELYADMQAGTFIKASHATVLREQRILVENINAQSEYLSDHITNYIPLNGRLPGDREAMLHTIDEHSTGLENNAALKARFASRDALQSL